MRSAHSTLPAARRTQLRDYFNVRSAPFWAVHAVALGGVLYLGWSWTGFLLAVGSYFFRMFFVTAGYHRYFSHRAYKTSRLFQAVLAFFAETSSQRGVLWWAAHHRAHHKYSDTPLDPHSPQQRGLLWAHLGWILSGENDTTDLSKIGDFAKYPELRWLDRFWLVPPVLYAVALWLVGSWDALLWGFFVSTVLLWHGTFTINSLTHVWGRPRFPSQDDSRNHWFLAFITMGEGWHNNHHYYQSSANQGFYWWEYDFSYWLLRLMAAVRLVWGLRKPPARVLALGRAPRAQSAKSGLPRTRRANAAPLRTASGTVR